MLLSPTIVPPSETEGITAGPELLLPTGAFPNRSGGDRQSYTFCMDIMSVHFEWRLGQDILLGNQICPF